MKDSNEDNEDEHEYKDEMDSEDSGDAQNSEGIDVDETNNGPIIDEDGFQLVKGKGGRNRR